MIGLFILEILLVVLGMHLLKKYDEKAGIEINKKEYVIMGLIFVLQEIVLFSFYGYGREFVWHSLVLYYLIFAAFIDYKTKNVYRLGSICFIVAAIIGFIFSKDINTYEWIERIICIFIFSLISVMQGTLGWMGWGDVLTYIGVFFSLATWKYDCMTLELFMLYMLIANVLFLLGNITNFDWNKKRLKNDAAFLPGMAGAFFILEIVLCKLV